MYKDQEGLLINLGAGAYRDPAWVSLDFNPVKNCDYTHDLNKAPYPFKDRSASIIYASHSLEHLSYKNAWTVFKEAHRILKPRGLLRITVPNVQVPLANYANDTFGEWFKHLCENKEFTGPHPTPLMTLAQEFFFCGDEVDRHRSAWDFQTLKLYFEKTGFIDIEATERFESRSALMNKSGFDNRPLQTLYLEGIKK